MKKIVLLLICFVNPVFAEEVDNRQVLNLTEPQRNHVLNEMRSLLTGVQSIVGALAKDDMADVAESAKAIGFDMKHKAENPLHDVLPKDFMMLGMSMHKDFDVIAADAATSKDSRHTLKQLNEVMGKCTACHATYQIRPSQAMNADKKASEARLDDVAVRGRHVMSFNLEQTTHVFTKTEKGGVQQVIVKDKANTAQITLIREHLSKIPRNLNKVISPTPLRFMVKTCRAWMAYAKPGRDNLKSTIKN
jgi:cytochrome c556